MCHKESAQRIYYMQFYFLVFWSMKEIVFLSKGKGLWSLLSVLDKSKFCWVLVRCVRSWGDKKYYIF